MKKILSNLIKIESVNPPGGEIEVAEYLNAFSTCTISPVKSLNPNMDGQVLLPTLEMATKKSFIFLIPMSYRHRRADFPPFSGEIKNGLCTGGERLIVKGWPPSRLVLSSVYHRQQNSKGKLIFAATADEEVGGELGVGILAEKYPEKIRADFAINEGAESLRINGKDYHSLSAGKKARHG